MPSTASSPPRRILPLAVGLMAGLLVALLYLQVAVPWEDSWGATAADSALALPGDELVPNPYHQIQHVVTVNAAPEQVWPWLIQLGQDRAGFYSYDWLENLFGAGIDNHLELRPEWQTRQVGELVPAVRAGYLGGRLGDGLGWSITFVQPNRALGLANWGTFALVPQPDGSTRLIARQRRRGPEPAAAWPVVTYLFNPAHFVMERRMLLHIKALAEGRSPTPSWVDLLAEIGWWVGAAALAFYFLRRRHWWMLIAGTGAGALVFYATRDAQAVLAAFMGLGLALLGIALFRWWALLWIVLLGVFTYAVLALAPDAWIGFGLVFGAAAIVAGIASVTRQRQARRGAEQPTGVI